MGFDTSAAQASWHPLLEIADVWQDPTSGAVRWSLARADMEDADSFTDLVGDAYPANSATSPPALTYNRFGTPSGAMDYNGSSDRLEADAALALIGSSTAGAIAAWIKPDDGQPSAAQAIACFGDTNAQEFIVFGVQQDGKLFGQCYVAGVIKWSFTTSVVFEDGPRDWTHVCLSHNGTTYSAYANGSALTTTTIPGDATIWLAGCAGIDNVRIGCKNYNSTGDAQFFSGAIHDVRIYTAAITALQLARLSATSTLRYSDIDLALSDGTLYEGRIRSMTPLRQDLGRLLEAQFVLPELTIDLHNGDDAVRVLLDANDNFVGRAVTLKMGQGTTAGDYETRFTGQIRYPDGVQWDDEVASLTFSDDLEGDNAILPANKIFPDTYPNAESKSSFLCIPEVLGDFRTTAGGGETVPGFCVNTKREAGTGYVARWLLAEAEMQDADTFTDVSGNAYHANSVAGAPTFTTGHTTGSDDAMVFNGTTDAVNADAVLAAAGNDTQGTLAFWIKLDEGRPASFQCWIAFGDTDANQMLYFGHNVSGKMTAQFYSSGSINWVLESTDAIFASGPSEWMHIAIVQDGVHPAMYVDGVAISLFSNWWMSNGRWLSHCPDFDNVRLGARNRNSLGDENFFAGAMSDVRIYSTALDAAGVAVLLTYWGQFTFGQHLEQVEAVYLNGAACSYRVDQLTGPSLVTIQTAYTPATDSVAANVYGRVSSAAGGSYSGYYDVPTAWAYDLLIQSWGMGLSALTRVDIIGWSKSFTYYGSRDRCRRWIGSDLQVATLLAELCHDGFFELVLGDDAKYRPVFRLAGAPSSAPLFREVDILPTGRGRALRVASDPERTYANQIAYDYRYQPPTWNGETLEQTREFGAGGVVDDEDEQALTGRRVRRRVQCRWLYNDAEGRANRDLYVFGTRLEMLTLDLGPRALTLEKGDTIGLIYGKYGASDTIGTPLMVRSISPDYGAMMAQVTAWNIDTLSPRRYQVDGSAAWTLATAYDQAVMGFYGAFVGDDQQLYM